MNKRLLRVPYLDSIIITPIMSSTFVSDVPSPSRLSIHQQLWFIELCLQLVPYLNLHRPDPSIVTLPSTPPYELPANALFFLADCIFQDHSTPYAEIIQDAWRTLSRSIWSSQEQSCEGTHLLDQFLQFGTRYEIGMLFTATTSRLKLRVAGFVTIGPPCRVCPDPDCKERRQGFAYTLGEPKTHSAILFTKRYGPVPAYSTSLYCRGKPSLEAKLLKLTYNKGARPVIIMTTMYMITLPLAHIIAKMSRWFFISLSISSWRFLCVSFSHR
jgi:CxC5 like cysteine cluster associated with KDZ transposases